MRQLRRERMELVHRDIFDHRESGEGGVGNLASPAFNTPWPDSIYNLVKRLVAEWQIVK